MFTPVKLQCVFGEEQIEQILKHCEHIFSVVDIWHVNVAEEVLFVFSQVFRDVNVFISEDEPENEDTVDFAHWNDEGFDFEIEYSVLADIPQQFLSTVEDTLSLHGQESESEGD